jgi:hypothetical protein
MQNSEHTISIAEFISQRLGFRSSAEEFFNSIESIPVNKLKVDFKGTKSISRSFAHEYLLQKKESEKQIVDCNVPKNIQKMFYIVNNTTEKHKIERDIQKTIVLSSN